MRGSQAAWGEAWEAELVKGPAGAEQPAVRGLPVSRDCLPWERPRPWLGFHAGPGWREARWKGSPSRGGSAGPWGGGFPLSDL